MPYRDAPSSLLAALPRPEMPHVATDFDGAVVDLGATSTLLARFEVAGARVEETFARGAIASRDGVVLAASVVSVADKYTKAYPRTRGILRASVPSSLGRVLVVCRRRAEVLERSALDSAEERDLGDPAARDAFFVRGDHATVRTLFGPEVCALLLEVEPVLWRLEVGAGTVELEWRASVFDPVVVLPVDAVQLVVTIARAAVDLPRA